MEHLETISKMTLAGLAIWRLSRTVQSSASPAALRAENFPASRAIDFFYWICVWMSAQTTLWVVCGFSGVLLNWLALAGVARVMHLSEELPGATACTRDFPPVDVPVRERPNGASELCL